MKLLQPSRRFRCSAFSMVELQLSIGVLAIVVGGALAAHFFGLRMFYRSRQTVGAAQEARVVLGKIREEVRGCNSVIVGMGDHIAFREIPDLAPQAGNAVQIFPTTNLNDYVIYYRADDNTVRKWNTRSGSLSVLARNVTNEYIFTAKDYRDNVLTNNENNRVIEISLKFLQGQADKGATSFGGLHDFYQVSTKATRRKIL